MHVSFIKFQLPIYATEQQECLDDITIKLVDTGMAYPNPSASWASELPLFPMAENAKFPFTVSISSVILFAIAYRYPLPNLDIDLNKLPAPTFLQTRVCIIDICSKNCERNLTFPIVLYN